MNIAIFDISATKRAIIKSSISSNKSITNLYLFGSIDSLAKLPFFSNINIIIMTADSVKSNIAFFTKFTSDRNFTSNIIFLYDHEIQSTLDFLKSVKNLTECYVPSLNKNGDFFLRDLKIKLFPVIDKIIKSIKSESIKSEITAKKPFPKIDKYCAIFIGVSMGGPKALRTFLPELLENIELPIIIVQHMMAKFSQVFVETLSTLSEKKILLAENNMLIENNTVYIAPGGIHTEIGLNKNNELIILHNDSPPEQSCKPSINYLFRSAAEVCKEKSIAVILTGMGKDGTDGILKLSEHHAYTIAQDEKSCEVWGMPQSAIQTGCITQVLPLNKIANHISELLS